MQFGRYHHFGKTATSIFRMKFLYPKERGNEFYQNVGIYQMKYSYLPEHGARILSAATIIIT